MTEWIPVALARDVEVGSVTGTTVDGGSVALWRGSSGGVHAWADRCPHRGMRLSLGFVRGERLVCLYHGWQFDSAGACRHIPAHPDITPPAAVHAVGHRVWEQAAIVWVATTDADAMEMPSAADGVPGGDAAAVPACSVWVDSDRRRVLDEIAFGADEFDIDAASVQAVVGGVPVIIGIQEVAADRTALHIAVRGTVDVGTVASVVRWAHGLRDDVHRAVGAVAS